MKKATPEMNSNEKENYNENKKERKSLMKVKKRSSRRVFHYKVRVSSFIEKKYI